MSERVNGRRGAGLLTSVGRGEGDLGAGRRAAEWLPPAWSWSMMGSDPKSKPQTGRGGPAVRELPFPLLPRRVAGGWHPLDTVGERDAGAFPAGNQMSTCLCIHTCRECGLWSMFGHV